MSLPYGFMLAPDSHIIIDPEKANIVRTIYQQYLSGMSLGGIADFLFRHGIPSPKGKDHWTQPVLSNILSNQKYIGYIVSFDDFFLAQGEKSRRNNIDKDTNKRKTTRYSSQSVLSGLFVCAECNHISSEQELALLLFGCISFLDSSFDYLVLMFADENKQVKPSALKIPRRMIEKIKASMESGCEIQNDNMSLPYPTDVTEQMLKCFHSEFILQPKNPVDHDLSPISEIAEELWIYSKLRELLVDPGDSNYLKASLEPVQQNIFKMFQMLSKCLSPDNIQQLSAMCEKVFAGISFNDDSFNMLIERLIISTNKIN